VRALLSGAGFTALHVAPLNNPFWLQVRARRARSLPDLVGPDLRLLICGFKPSLYSADVGIALSPPGDRFWPAARAAGLVERERDPRAAFRRGIGMTDLVKRATSTAGALRQNEYAVGLRRVEALVRLYQPGAICFVGLDGWRQVADRTAQ